MSVLIVGSIALDTVKTPVEEHSDLLGGSASYAAVAASYFSPVRLVGIVGSDFPQSEFYFWKSRKIDTAGVQRVNGKTFHWSGEYEDNMNNRRTLLTELGVFETFTPTLPKAYQASQFVLLANIAPALQHHVLNQMRRPRFVVAKTSNNCSRMGRGIPVSCREYRITAESPCRDTASGKFRTTANSSRPPSKAATHVATYATFQAASRLLSR